MSSGIQGAVMKFGQIMRDEQKLCLVGAQIEMFDFFVGTPLPDVPVLPAALPQSHVNMEPVFIGKDILFKLANVCDNLSKELALTRERVMAGLVAARRRGRRGGRPPSIDAETIEQITAALDAGASKASVCRSFKVPRSTLIGTLDRIGWTGPVKA